MHWNIIFYTYKLLVLLKFYTDYLRIKILIVLKIHLNNNNNCNSSLEQLNKYEIIFLLIIKIAE